MVWNRLQNNNLPQDENRWWRKDKSLPLSNSQNNCLTWWTILVTINKIPTVYTCIDCWSYDMHSFSPQQKAEVAHSPTLPSCFPNQWKDVLHRSGSPHTGSGPSVLPCSSPTSQNTFTHDNIARQLYKKHKDKGFFYPLSLSDVTSLKAYTSNFTKEFWKL